LKKPLLFKCKKNQIMNLLAPISTIMTKNVIAVSPDESLARVREIFEKNKIHHVPVVRYKTIVGMISKTDFVHFLHGFKGNEMDKFIDETRLRSWKAEEIMTKGLAKVDSTEAIRNVLEVFMVNRFHAIPIVDNDELVGIVTTFDIIKAVAKEPVTLEDYKKAKA
jgi:acetoin utilization protein AcuB